MLTRDKNGHRGNLPEPGYLYVSLRLRLIFSIVCHKQDPLMRSTATHASVDFVCSAYMVDAHVV